MADPKGLPEVVASCRAATRGRARIRDWEEVYEEFGRARCDQAQASRCMDCGIPFCNNGCPLGNLIPDWNDLVYRGRLARRDRSPARDQQLPGVHRAAVPGAVRGGLRARHQPGPGDDQAGRGVDHRPRLGRGLGRAAAPGVAHRQDGRRDRLRTGRPGSRAAAHPRRSHGGRCSSEPTASAACCATASPSSRWRSAPRPPPRPDGGRGHEFRTGATSARTRHRGLSAGTYDAVVLAMGRRVARPAGARPRVGRHPPGDGVPAPGQPGAAGRPGGLADRRRPASTSSSSAAATPAPTAWARPSGRARRRSRSWRSCRSRPSTDRRATRGRRIR
jgi:hypothetical protein